MSKRVHGYDQPHKSDTAGEMLGVTGRWTHKTVKPGRPVDLFCRQRFVTEWRAYDGGKRRLRAEVRFDDDCDNGRNGFAITATGHRKESHKYRDGIIWADDIGGCCHDEIAAVFPELAPLIKWHLCATDGPMHYFANTIYHAGDRDHNRLRKGEKRQLVHGRTKQPVWTLVAIGPDGQELPTYKLPGLTDAPTCPTDQYRLEWRPSWIVGEGKERQLDSARNTAVWPEATDEQLSAEPAELRAMLEARLPALLTEFRAAIEGAGFLWSADKEAQS